MKLKKSITVILAAGMLLSTLASCTGGNDNANHGSVDVNKYAGMSYDEASSAIYNDVLGDFGTLYAQAKEAENLSERFALMALAEAKLLETAVMIPTSAQGGNYAISRTAPYTVPFVLWGNDADRFHSMLVTTEPITTAHRDEMKAKWNELKGTGTYEQWAKDYLKEKGYTLKDTYAMSYASDPQTWDVLSTSRTVDSEAIVNTFDGLYEYDNEGVLQPALAESYTMSEDGLTYTFKLRPGLIWVDSQGRKVADLKADDFVAGMQHMLETNGDLNYLVEGVIANASEYINGAITDFSQVGVKAVDDTTLVYTLAQPRSYFMTMLGYSIFAPMSRSYYASQGGKFGSEFDASAASYLYGKTPDNIAYCGPYLVTNSTEKNTIVFSANESYWNKDNINLKSITWLFNDGSDATKAYNDMLAGTIDGCGLNASALEIARKDGNFDKYHYISTPDATTFSMYFNINRGAYANFNDATKAVSTQTEEQKSRAHIAMGNVHFRRALSYSFDRGAYNAQKVGDELKYLSLRNSYTPWNFVFLEEDVKVDINGKSTKFAAGTPFGEIVQAQLDADGVKIKAYDPTADNGAGSGDGYDGWFNPEEAAAELALAVKDLAEAGVEISKENPIVFDLPYPASSTTYTNTAQAFKMSIEKTLDSKVIVNLVVCNDANEWYSAGYLTDYGSEANYDFYDCSGWGPDYGDPASYLDTFLSDYAGYMVKCIGIF